MALLSVYLTYRLAPSQETSANQAVEQAQRNRDASTPPAKVEDVSRAPDGPNVASDAVVDLDGKPVPTDAAPNSFTQGTDLLLPDPTYLGMFAFKGGEAVPGAKTHVEFTLTGLRHETVRIEDITAQVTKRRPSPKGTIIFYPPQGNIPFVKLGFDLDSPDTSARTIGGSNQDEVQPTHYFRENTVTLKDGESQGFNSVIVTTGCACEFNLHVQFSDGSSLTINDKNGKPFYLAAYRDDYARYYSPQFSPPGATPQTVLTQCESLVACSHIAYKRRQ